MTRSPIAITGMACRFAGAPDVAALWRLTLEARATFRAIPSERWRRETFYSSRSRQADRAPVERGAFLEDITSFAAMHFGVAPRRAALMDPQQRLILDAVRVAWQDAGYERDARSASPRRRTGTFLGVSTSEYRHLLTSRVAALQMCDGDLGAAPEDGRAIAEAVERIPPISAFSMPGTLLNMVAANVAQRWDFGGPAFTIDAACASSLIAVAQAALHLRAGLCDAAVAGGVYLNLHPVNALSFARIGAISRRGECRPFDHLGDGFLQGEGVGVVILKRLDDALRDGDRVHAVLCGFGMNNDGADSSGPMAPSARGQQSAIELALDDAGWSAERVDLIECHGTATAVGDAAEVDALRAVYGERSRPLWLSSIKANIGHTMSAAGVAGLIKAASAISRATIPPQAGYDAPRPELRLAEGPFEIATTARPWETDEVRRAGVSAFGFGGTNCHVVLEAAPSASRRVIVSAPDRSASTTLIALSAPTPELLARHLREVAAALRDLPHASLQDIAWTLGVTRRLESARIAIITDDVGALPGRLEVLASRIDEGPEDGALDLDAYFTAAAPSTPAPIALMFPGQGAQRPGLLRGWYDRFGMFRARLDALAATVDASLLEILFGGEDTAERLQETAICQPVMVALGLALSGFLIEDLGVRPAVTVGHSLGEFAAAATAGMLSPQAALAFVARRGLLMTELASGEPGAMAAMMASPARVEVLLDPTLDVVIANRNHPRQSVVSGPLAGVEALLARAQEARIKGTRLRVSHAFHSPLMKVVEPALSALVSELELSAPRLPVVSAITGEPYSDDLAATRRVFIEHATHAVDFVEALRCCEALGAELFLQAGAGTTLTAFAAGALPGRRASIRTLASVAEDHGRELHRALGLLISRGHSPTLGALHDAAARRPLTLPATPLIEQPYWVIQSRRYPLMHPSVGGVVSSAPTSSNPRASEPSTLETPTPPTEAARGLGEPPEDITRRVLEAIAVVSAFPVEALSTEQELSGGLGFDSLMFIDLAGQLQRRFPGFEGLPQSQLSARTTIGEVAELVREQVSRNPARGGPTDASSDVEALTLHRYRPTTAPATISDDGAPPPLRGALLITLDPTRRGASLIAPLAAAHPDVTIIEVTLGAPFNGVAIDARHVRLAWPDDPKKTGALFEVLRDAGATPSALVHAAPLAIGPGLFDVLDAAASWPDHITTTLQLAAHLERAWDGAPDALVTLCDPASALWSGALEGAIKALTREWPAGTARHLELGEPLEWPTASLRLTGSEPVLRVTPDGPRRPALEPAPFTEDDAGDDLTRELFALELASGPSTTPLLVASDVLLITGGGRGIGAAIAEDIARRCPGCKLIIAGRTPLEGTPDLRARLDAMRAAGAGRVEYICWDVREPSPSMLTEVTAETGAITGIIHCAGILRDRRVRDKTVEDARAVIDVKVGGLIHALRAVDRTFLRLLIGASSWSARFGAQGQSDYAAANALMDRLIETLAEAQPAMKAASIDWPPWRDSDMVGTIPPRRLARMRAAGVPFIRREEGLAAFWRELATPGGGAVLYGGPRAPEDRQTHLTRASLSLETHPFLNDHRPLGSPLLPLAASIDYIAWTARALAPPDASLTLEAFEVYAGVDVERATSIQLEATREPTPQGLSDARVTLRQGATLACRARAVFGPLPTLDASAPPSTPLEAPPLSLEDFYRDITFHGPRLRGVEHIEGLDDESIRGIVRASRPSDWIVDPARAAWTIDPMVIDASLQLVSYWLWTRHHRRALPSRFDRFAQRASFAEGPVRCVVTRRAQGDPSRFIGVIRYESIDGEPLAILEGIEARLIEDERVGSP